MIDNLDQSDPTKYIRHFWNATHHFTRDKALYRDISKEIKEPRDSAVLLDSLSKNAKYYRAMTSPIDDITFSDQNLRSSLISLKTLKARSFYPVVLAMKQSLNLFSEQDIAEVLNAIEILVFRNFTICGKVANRSEVFFANTALNIYNGNLSSKDSIVSHIKDEIVGDKEFSDMFDIWSGSNGTKEIVRYILRKIHRFIDNAMEINVDNSSVHIEHIMPEDCSMWNVDSETHDTYLWRLGNLALLSGTFNISISNKPFEDKKQRYSESKIEPNKELAALNSWGVKEIEARQAELRKYAVKIWAK